MKKFISMMLSAILALCVFSPVFAAYTDADSSASYYESAIRLQDLGIINGYDDNTFRAGNQITRAEFTKIVICMMDEDTAAKSSSSTSSFYDVAQGSWFAPYVNYAVQKKILSGYSDGSFGPDKTISYGEALTILMRVLGYDETNVGYYWPDNYVTAATSLGITGDMNYNAYVPLSRGTAAILVDNALFAKPSSGSGTAVTKAGNSSVQQTNAAAQQMSTLEAQQGYASQSSASSADTYLETIGYTVLDDALVLDIDGNNTSILAGNLKLNNAATYISKTQMTTSEGSVYKHAVIDRDGYLVTYKNYDSSKKEIYSLTVVANKLTDNTLEYTSTQGLKGTFKFEDSFVTYYDNSKQTYAAAKQHITAGTDVTFYGNSYGAWSIAVIGSENDIDPVRATKNYSDDADSLEGTPINKSNLIVYRDGKAAELGDIRINDVVYYNTKSNTMEVYSKKVTGVYYSASPSKAYVESVTVGGKSYEIGYSAATGKLDASSGAYKIGDKVTLLLGKNDKIVFAIDNNSDFDYFSYGVLLSTSSRVATEGDNEGNTENIASVFMTDGQTYDIVTAKDYKSIIGNFVNISYDNGVAVLTSQRISDKGAFAGEIDLNQRTINGKYVLKDAAIIQRTSDDDAAVASCELLDFDNLTAKTLEDIQVINGVTANSFGDIAILYVKNLENTYNYGVISGFERIKVGDEKQTVGYKIYSDGQSTSYALNTVGGIRTSIGSAVGYKTNGGQLSKLVALTKIGSASSIRAVEGSRIMLGSEIYKMDANVKIVNITNTDNMQSITVDELDALKNITSVTLYSDKAKNDGGIVRVVTVVTGK